jgi:putative transposase
LVGRAGLEPATNGLKDRVPIEPKYLARILLSRLDCGKQLPTTGRKSTALLRALRDFPHNRRLCVANSQFVAQMAAISKSCHVDARRYDARMREIAMLLLHLVMTVARLVRPGGARSVVAESLLLKHQLMILNRRHARAPNLRPMDRVIAGLCASLMRPARLLRSAIVLKPSTIMAFHRALVQRKYRLLFTPKRHGTPGPKGPSSELIAAIVAMKRKNPRFGCPRIAQQLRYAFGVAIDKDVVRRVLAKHYRPEPGGPSWLSFLGHSKDSLWSVDLFRCESLILKTHWVMVVMDQCTRRIIGFAVHAGVLDGPAVCRLLGRIIGRAGNSPRALSSDHDPLFESPLESKPPHSRDCGRKDRP